MTKATTEGRRLVLTVEGVDPFIVDPLPAKRGKYLTDRFILTSIGQLTAAQAEPIFIESIGSANYSRMAGLYVDLVRLVGEAMTPEILATWGPSGILTGDESAIAEHIARGAVLLAREARESEPVIIGEPIRQEEAEALALCAFYWQTVVGIEAVNAFLEAGEGTEGSLKAVALLQYRLGLSPSPNSSSTVTGTETPQQGDSFRTPATGNSSGSVRMPADHLPPQSGRRGKRRRG